MSTRHAIVRIENDGSKADFDLWSEALDQLASKVVFRTIWRIIPWYEGSPYSPASALELTAFWDDEIVTTDKAPAHLAVRSTPEEEPTDTDPEENPDTESLPTTYGPNPGARHGGGLL